MGLYMRRNFMHSRKLWIILLLGLFFIVSSCTKELDKEELGPAISFNEVAQHFSQITKIIDPSRINAREWVVSLQKGIIMGQRLDRDAEILTELDLYNVADTQCGEEDGTLINYKETVNKKVNGKNENFESDKSACISKSRDTLLLSYLMSLVAPKDTINSFHDLSMVSSTESAPQAVVDQGCPNMPSCTIRVFNLKFKQKLIFPDGETIVRQLAYKISPDVPYLARDLSFCISLAVDLDGSDIPLQQCLEVRNFGTKQE